MKQKVIRKKIKQVVAPQISKETAMEMLGVVKTEKGIMDLMKLCAYEVNLCRKGIDLLKKEANVMRVIRETGFHKSACDKGMAVLTEEKNIMLVMEKSGWEHQICYKGVRKIDLQAKTEGEIKALIVKSNFSLAICRHAIPFLKPEEKTWEELVALLADFSYSSFPCRYLAPFFNFSERDSTENYEIIRSTGYNSIITIAATPHLSEDNIMKIIMESGFKKDICRNGLKRLSNHQKILDILLRHTIKYDLQTTNIGINRINEILNTPIVQAVAVNN